MLVLSACLLALLAVLGVLAGVLLLIDDVVQRRTAAAEDAAASTPTRLPGTHR